jgi:RND family efflux transporter MFP subunit
VVRTVLSALLAIIALGVFLAWMGGVFRHKVPPGEVPVSRPTSLGRTLVTVEKVRSYDTVAVVGSVQPKKRTEVASQLLATVLEVRVRPGDRVNTHDPLVILDDRELLAQQREATASLTAAEADLITRRTDYERMKKLREAGSVSADEFSKVEGAYRVAEALVTRAKEVISRLTVQLTYTKIQASSPGVVSDRLVEPGDLATPGKPLLVIYDPTDLELHANIPESLAPMVPVGAKLPVRIDAAGLSTQGTVREVVPQAQQATRSVLVKITLPSSESAQRLLPGMFGRVEIPTGFMVPLWNLQLPFGISERLWIPRAAVRQVGQLDLVDVANPDGTLSRRFVRIGQQQGNHIEILSGLSAGEQVALPQ